MKCFTARNELKFFFFFLVCLSAFSQTSFCDDIKDDTRRGDVDALSSEQGTGKKVEAPFDENTPIDISSPRVVSEAGDKGVTSTQSSSGAYNRESSDEFRLETASQELSYASHVFRLVFSLALVAGLAYIAIRFMRRGSLFTANNDPYLKLVANLNIEQGKTIKVVTIGEKAYIIGVAGNNITKIGELDDQVLLDAMKLKAEGDAEHDGTSFTKVFSNFFAKKREKDGARVSGSAKDGLFKESFNDQFLRSQQERLKNINIQDEGEEIR